MATETITDRARRFAVPAILVLIGLTVAYFFLLYQPPESLGDIETALKDRGKILVVGGDDLVDIEAPGATLVPLSREREIGRLLEGRDEAAVVRALQKRGYKALLADTRLARLDRLTKVSI